MSPAGVVSPFATLPGTRNLHGLAFDTSANLYVVGFHTDEITEIAPNGATSLFATLPANSQGFGLAIDGSGARKGD